MNTALWTIQVALALFFVMPAVMKLTSSREKMIDQKQLPPDGSPVPIRILGGLELLGVVGIIAPWATGILPILTPITAVCFAIVLVAALGVHYKKKEYKILPVLLVMGILAGVVAWYRF